MENLSLHDDADRHIDASNILLVRSKLPLGWRSDRYEQNGVVVWYIFDVLVEFDSDEGLS